MPGYWATEVAADCDDGTTDVVNFGFCIEG